MRRKERQVTDIREIMDIVEKCEVCRLGMYADGVPYIVPMNFGYTMQGRALTLFFHCAKEGRKLDILRKNPQVCFEMDFGHAFVRGPDVCDYSYRYESIIGNGVAEFADGTEEKAFALQKIIEHYAGAGEYPPAQPQIDAVTVLKVCTEDYTAKRS